MQKRLVFFCFIIILLTGLYLLFPEIFVYDSLDIIKKYHDKWLVFFKQKPLDVILLFIIFNMVMALLPVPGISMISFLGGSIFGFYQGFFYSSFATALGNLFGFFLARYFMRDWVMEKYGAKVLIFKNDWQSRGAMALFSFRLFPLIPSFVANLIMGVSPLHWWTFFWVSWVGRIPMVMAYTYAGVKVASIEHISEVLHPSILVVFIVLAALPWILKYLVLQKSKAL